MDCWVHPECYSGAGECERFPHKYKLKGKYAAQNNSTLDAAAQEKKGNFGKLPTPFPSGGF